MDAYQSESHGGKEGGCYERGRKGHDKVKNNMFTQGMAGGAVE